MAALQNPITPIVRVMVACWVESRKGFGFTLAEAGKAIELMLPNLSGADVCKSVSNELIRLVDKGFLSYTMLERNGESGRPPRLYTKTTPEQAP